MLLKGNNMAREGWARAKEVTDLNWDGLLAFFPILNSQDRCISGHTRSQLRGSSEGFSDRTGAQKVYYQRRCRACVYVISHTSPADAPIAPDCLSYDSAATSGCFAAGQFTCDHVVGRTDTRLVIGLYLARIKRFRSHIERA